MKSFKAPGPDGFKPFFYKQYWLIIIDDLWKMVADAYRDGLLT